MTKLEFIKGIQRAVYAPTIAGTLSILANPPGRKPSPVLIELSQWFTQLPDQDRERVQRVIQLGVRHAVFGMLAVLDNVKSISEQGEIGSLELRYESAAESILINGPAHEALHDLFASEVPPP